MVAAIVLISSTEEISTVKPCHLKKVLEFLSVDNTSPCKYDDIKNDSTDIRNWGISLLVLSSIMFLLILNFTWILKNNIISIHFALVGIVVLWIFSIMYAGKMIDFYKEIVDSKETQKDSNYAQIKSAMINRLQDSYTSDNLTNGGAISNNWNKFFIEYDCCAVNQVQGTTNDFDSTPWCTTSGSCQTTASQIPKTCCNYVTEEDYGNAPIACHSSVNPGTFKSNCMAPIKKLSTINIEECEISLLLITLLTIGILEIAESCNELILIIMYVCCIRMKIHVCPK
ncbi:uncharacterized protein [Magallana gigas]